MGIARLIPCRSSFDLLCIIARQTAEKGVYTAWAQDNLIQVDLMPYANEFTLIIMLLRYRLRTSAITTGWMCSTK